MFLFSVTDCYNEFEEKYELTRNVLKQLVEVDCELSVSKRNRLEELKNDKDYINTKNIGLQ